jgi:hypothetical protein
MYLKILPPRITVLARDSAIYFAIMFGQLYGGTTKNDSRLITAYHSGYCVDGG